MDKILDDEVIRNNARNMRWKSPAIYDLKKDNILEELQEITDVCDNASYDLMTDEILEHDDEEELRIAFQTLSNKAYSLQCAIENLDEYSLDVNFDSYIVNLFGEIYKVQGFDSYEEDYFGLTSCEIGLALEKTAEKLMRLTKQRLIGGFRQAVGTALSYLIIRQDYYYLLASTNFYNAEKREQLNLVKSIVEQYEKANEDNFICYYDSVKKFNSLTECLPDTVWLY